MTTPSQPPRSDGLSGKFNPEEMPGQTNIYDVLDHSQPATATSLWPMATMAQKAQAAVHAKLKEKEKRKP